MDEGTDLRGRHGHGATAMPQELPAAAPRCGAQHGVEPVESAAHRVLHEATDLGTRGGPWWGSAGGAAGVDVHEQPGVLMLFIHKPTMQ